MPLTHHVREVNLKTGAKGLIVNVPDSTVMNYTISFHAGNDFVKRPEIHQTAHLMEHMAFGPNAQFPSMEAFSQEFSRNGAYSNASTFDTSMMYYADCAQFEWERILRLQQLAVTQPKFLPKILAAEKGNVREELTAHAHNSARVLWQAIGRAMGGHSLNDAEKIATIDAVTVEDIAEHHKRTHTHKNMRFVLAGNFRDNGDKAVELLESWKLETGERLQPIADKLHTADPVAIARTDQENNTFGFTMMLERELSINDIMAMSALNHLLTDTFHSRIFGKARARGICYGVGSSANQRVDGASSWEFYGQVRPDNAEALFYLVQRELQRIADGDISEQDVDDAKQYLTGEFQMRGQTVSALGNWYASGYFFDETIDNIGDIDKHIEAITKEHLVQIAREFIDTNIWAFGEIGATKPEQVQQHYNILAPLFKA